MTTQRLELKPGAALDARHFRPEMARAFQVALEEAPACEGDVVTVTSGADDHPTGLHPLGYALDFRGKSIRAGSLPERRDLGKRWAQRVSARLGSDYDVLFEIKADPDRDHLHVEFDPDGGIG